MKGYNARRADWWGRGDTFEKVNENPEALKAPVFGGRRGSSGEIRAPVGYAGTSGRAQAALVAGRETILFWPADCPKVFCADSAGAALARRRGAATRASGPAARFRHAEPSLFREHADRVGEEGLVTLADNFRSRPGLVDFANHCFGPLFDGNDLVGWTPLTASGEFAETGETDVTVLLTGGESAEEYRRAEARAVARRIRETVAEEEIRIATWIDANVPYWGSYRGPWQVYEKDRPDFRLLPLPGRNDVTLRQR